MSLLRKALENTFIEEANEDEEEFIGFDLDGTMAFYDGWKGVDHIGEPIQKVLDLIRDYRSKNIKVKIFTARVSAKDPLVRQRAHDTIKEWTIKYLGEPLEVTCIKSMRMIRLYDDIARQVIKNEGEVVLNG